MAGGQTNLNVWEKKSQIYEIPNVTSPSINLAILPYNQNDKIQNCSADGVLFIDLTEAFGENNEPTKEWCDENLDYFDGTKTLTFTN